MEARELTRARLGETAAVGFALALVAVLLLGDYVVRGGFAWDDWANSATTAYPPAAGYLGPLNLGLFGFRPLLALLIAGSHTALGPNPELHLALGLLLALALSMALFAVLRELRVERAPAAAVAALVLVFPWSDSTRLWATAGLNNLAVVLWLVGVLLALRSLDAHGRRRQGLHGAALAVYVASVLIYQATAGLVLVSVLVYAHRAGWGLPVVRRLGVVAVVPLLVALLIGSHAGDTATSVKEMLTHAGAIASHGLALLGQSLVPVGGLPARAARALGLGVIAAAWVAWRATSAGTFRERTEPPQGLSLALGGIAVLLCSYAVFVPAAEKYVPLARGTANRVNMVAALGYALVVVGAATALATSAAAALARVGVSSGRRGISEAAVSTALILAIGTGWALHLRSDASSWERAAALRTNVLAAIERRSGALGPGSTVLTVGYPVHVAPGIPVFGKPWDLDGAVKVTLRDGHVAARPLHPGESLLCWEHSMGPMPAFGDRPERAAYGRTLVLDVGSGVATRIDSRRACKALAARLAAEGLHSRSDRRPAGSATTRGIRA